jgi:hypothetical protein
MNYQRDKEVVKRQVAGETFLIPVRNRLADMRNIYVLHGVGEFIWDRLDDDSGSICDEIVARYDVDKEEAERDMDEHLQELLAADLISLGN